MRKKIFLLCASSLLSFNLFAQDSTLIKMQSWLTDNNFSIRKTFDGSKNENKPAGVSFQENHKSNNDFFNIDIALKLSQLELLENKKSSLIIYPKLEWHKSTDSTDLKNKIDAGINFEYIPFGLKAPNLPDGLPNDGLKVSPWFQGTSSFKRNFISNSNEMKFTFQVSLASNYQFLPGSEIRDSKGNFRARYYPYLGVEHYNLPNFNATGNTEIFSTYYFRLFSEIWILPQSLQLTLDGTYRQVLDNNTSIRKKLPLLSTSIYFYPGKQENFAIGYEYLHGYNNDNTFNLVQISSLKLAWKI